MNEPTDFLKAINTPALKPARMPPMENHAGAEVAKAWHDAITGNAPEQGLADTRKAASSWFEQFELAKPATKVL